MNPNGREVQMQRDIHRISLSLEDISRELKAISTILADKNVTVSYEGGYDGSTQDQT